MLCELGGEPMLLADLLAQDTPDEMAGVGDLGQSQRGKHLLTLAPGDDNAGTFEDRQMLRQVSLADVEAGLQDGEGTFSAAKQVEKMNAGGVGEGLADGGLALKNFVVE